jgi:hypothetical protein
VKNANKRIFVIVVLLGLTLTWYILEAIRNLVCALDCQRDAVVEDDFGEVRSLLDAVGSFGCDVSIDLGVVQRSRPSSSWSSTSRPQGCRPRGAAERARPRRRGD